MTNRQRFRRTMGLGASDRVPRFEEGIREEVIAAWRKQGLPADAVPGDLFPTDPRVEIAPDLLRGAE